MIRPFRASVVQKEYGFNPGRLAWAVIERRFAAQSIETPSAEKLSKDLLV